MTVWYPTPAQVQILLTESFIILKRNEVIDYFKDNNLYIKVSRKGTGNIRYAFLDTTTDKEKCFSYDFMGLILKEVFNKENNASL